MNLAKSICRTTWFVTAIAILLAAPSLSLAATSEDDLGKKYAEDVKKQYKLIKDPTVVDRVNQVGRQLADIANQTEVPASYGSSELAKFKYEFYVVDDPDPNAFSLPGGKIFVNSGLVKMVGSDDELAGVLRSVP